MLKSASKTNAHPRGDHYGLTGDGRVRSLGISSIALILSLVLLHVPAQIYSDNFVEFTFSLGALLAIAIIPFVGGTSLLAAPLFLANRRIVRVVVTLWFSIAVAAWVSTNFLILDIGPLDGRTTALNISTAFILRGALVLLFTCVVSGHLAWRAPSVAKSVAIVLNIVLVVLTSVALIQDRNRQHGKALGAQADGTLFRFSTSQNVLVILLDTFQSDYFKEIIDGNAAITDALRGFVFYPDTVGAARTTYLSMPVIHSGRMYDPDRALPLAYVEDVEEGSFMTWLAAAGYETSFINPVRETCPLGAALCVDDQTVLGDPGGAVRHEYSRLLDVSLLRIAPLYAKSWIYNGGAWRAQRFFRTQVQHSRVARSQRLLELIAQNAFATPGAPTAKFLHLFNTHPPVELGEGCGLLAQPAQMSRTTLMTQNECALLRVIQVLKRLDDLGVYDNTVIAIVADHGVGSTTDYASAEDQSVSKWPEIVGSANPLMLIKPIGSTGALTVSGMRVHIGDLAAAVCSQVDACNGRLRNTWLSRATERDRLYLHYTWKTEYWNEPKIKGVAEYVIDGPVWALNSWFRHRPPLIKKDAEIVFASSHAENVIHLDWGWAKPETWGVWTDGPQAALSFTHLPIAKRHVGVDMRLRVFLTPQHRNLRVRATANGRHAAEWDFKYPHTQAEVRMMIDPEVWSEDGGVMIRFYFDKPTSPASVGMSHDSRALGIGLEGLRINR